MPADSAPSWTVDHLCTTSRDLDTWPATDSSDVDHIEVALNLSWGFLGRRFDVADLDAPTLLFVHSSGETAIDHNQYVCGAHTYQANYEAGLRVLEIADDGALAEVAFFDTYLFRSVKICL